MSIAPAIIETEVDAAESQISAAWRAYQTVEHRGLEFGQVLYDWQQKLKGGTGRKGHGLSPMLETLKIPSSTAYYWIQRYKENEGIADVKANSKPSAEPEKPPMPEPSDSPNQPEPENKPATCPKCRAQFPSKNQLKKHACDAHGVGGADLPRWLHNGGDDFVPNNRPSPDDIEARVQQF